ncbi:pyridoxal phosphate (PLP)-dependent transferases superfamily protein [Wolffia australiana]
MLSRAIAAPLSSSSPLHRMLRSLPSLFSSPSPSSSLASPPPPPPPRSSRSTPMAALSSDPAQVAAAPRRRSQIAKRLEKFETTIFTKMSLLAAEHGAINLGQGFPNFDGPGFVKDAAIAAVAEGKNQYARGHGVPQLNSAIAARFEADTGLAIDPDADVTVTSGCTEAIAAAVLGLVDPGDEVILLAPFYDSYLAVLSMAGATVKSVTLRPPEFALPLEELTAAFSPRTRAILVNSPHNPTGKVLSRAELNHIAGLCQAHDALVFSDEVYDKLVFGGEEHVSPASIPGMYQRTVTMNSLGKTFSLTGWKVGWAVAPPALTWGIRQAHAYLTFATATPLQHAAAVALASPPEYYAELRRDYAAKKEILVAGLEEVGFTVYRTGGTYFVVADHTPFGFGSDVEFCEHLVREVGVVAIPTSVFYLDPEEGRSMVRFTFAKDEQTLRDAVARLKAHLRPCRH